jgi:hypothetical protein
MFASINGDINYNEKNPYDGPCPHPEGTNEWNNWMIARDLYNKNKDHAS